MKLRCAILDDYQNIALSMADWSTISEQVEVQTFNRHFENEDELVNTVNEYDIIVIMRERTSFSQSVFRYTGFFRGKADQKIKLNLKIL